MRKSLKFLAVAVVVLTIGASGLFAQEGSGAPAVAGVININTADAAQFALLPRLGLKAGERIVQYRAEHGPFKKTTDLMQVKGIGAKTYEGLSAYVAVEGKTTLSGKVRGTRKASKKPTPPASN